MGSTMFWLALSTASAFSLHTTDDGTNVRWPAFAVSYRVDSDDLPADVVQRAFDAWGGAGDTAIAFVPDPDSENRVWITDDWPFDEQLLAVTSSASDADGNLVRFDIRINAARPWATDGAAEAYDLQAAISHEVGHALGIEHSAYEEAIMYATMRTGDTARRTLHDDDREAAAFLYAKDEEEEAPPVDGFPVSCSTTGGPSSLGWLALLGLAGIRRRRA